MAGCLTELFALSFCGGGCRALDTCGVLIGNCKAAPLSRLRGGMQNWRPGSGVDVSYGDYEAFREKCKL